MGRIVSGCFQCLFLTRDDVGAVTKKRAAKVHKFLAVLDREGRCSHHLPAFSALGNLFVCVPQLRVVPLARKTAESGKVAWAEEKYIRARDSRDFLRLVDGRLFLELDDEESLLVGGFHVIAHWNRAIGHIGFPPSIRVYPGDKTWPI